jgi:hypothetical protein
VVELDALVHSGGYVLRRHGGDLGSDLETRN